LNPEETTGSSLFCKYQFEFIVTISMAENMEEYNKMRNDLVEKEMNNETI